MSSSSAEPGVQLEYLFNTSKATGKLTHIQLLSWSGRDEGYFRSNFNTYGRVTEGGDSGTIVVEYMGSTSQTLQFNANFSFNPLIEYPEVIFDPWNTTFVTSAIATLPIATERRPFFTVKLSAVFRSGVDYNSSSIEPEVRPTIHQMLLEAVATGESALLTDGMNLMALREESGDVVFNMANGEVAKAHKVILMGRCDYFLRMFASGMQEAVDNTIQVPDMTKSVMEVLLIFIYAGANATVNAMKGVRDLKACLSVFEAADKYGLDKLKELVALILVERTGMERGCGILVLQFLNGKGLPTLAHMVEVNLAYLLRE